MASLVHRFRAARFRQATEASSSELDVLLPPPLPLIHLPDEPRLARSGTVDGRPMHLPLRRHLHPEQRNLAPEPNLQESRLLLDASAQEQSNRAVCERIRVYEYNQPQVFEQSGAPSDTLVFDALFEGGNLQRVDRVVRDGVDPAKRHEYELWLHPDLKNSAYRQWFYFEVRGARRGVSYLFSIVNLAKSGALFGAGLQPCVYSAIEAETRQRGWGHGGSHVRYEASGVPDAAPGTNALHFQYAFAHDHDTVFFACLQPYSYTDLVEYLDKLERDPLRGTFVRRTELCQTIAQNACDLLSITGTTSNDALPPDDKKLIVVSARVHPGEPNASWMMKGMLDYLTGPSTGAVVLRNHFIFKVVPMLNPDGVINGNTRVNLAGWDLNRKWSSPVEKLFPTVFHLKRLLANWQMRDRVAVFCDLHGHSINRNIFTYGCFTKRANKKQNAAMNAAVNAATAVEQPSVPRTSSMPTMMPPPQPSAKNDPRVFPMIVAKNSEFFSFASCDFKVHKSKCNTARVVVHQELGVINSYTLEASFCGPDFGARKDTQFSTWDLEDMGRAWCQSLLVYFGLLPHVRALDKRREHEKHMAATATATAAALGATATVDTGSGMEQGLTIVAPDNAELLELNGDLLSDCEAAISELFASVDLLDDAFGGGGPVRGDACDSDLSGADEDAIPPNNGPEDDHGSGGAMAGMSPKWPPVVNGYASAPEEYSHGGPKAVAKKLKRRRSTRRKKNGGVSGAASNTIAAATADPAAPATTSNRKKLSRKKSKSRSRRHVDDQPEHPEAPGDDDEHVDADADGEGEREELDRRGDNEEDGESDGERSARRKKKKKKKCKTKQTTSQARRHHHHHRRRKDKTGSFRRVAPASDTECVASTATAVEDETTKPPGSARRNKENVVLPDLPGSSCSSTRKHTPTNDENAHAPVARVELPVATPPQQQQPHTTGSHSRSGSRKQSKLVRIVSSEPLELPPVGSTNASANHQQLYDLLASGTGSGSGRNVAVPTGPKHVHHREPPYDDDNDSDRSGSSSDDDDNGSSSSCSSSSSSSSEPRSAVSEFW